MNKSYLAFASLALAAPGAFLLIYPIYRRSELFAYGCMIVGVVLSFVLLGWSFWRM